MSLLLAAVAAVEAVERFATLLAPSRCAACDEATTLRVAFCAHCARSIERAATGTQAPFVYGGAMATAITRFKYQPIAELAGPLGLLLASAACERDLRIDVVVPVPLHTSRLLERGFNQAALLARPVARALEVPLRARALDRWRSTAKQADLGREERQSNVAGAFRVRERDLAGKRVLLVDDVRTTGATERACAAALREAGCLDVRTLVLAIAPPIAYP